MSLPQTSPSVALTQLDRADLTVLDLGLSYLVDALRRDPDVLPDPAEQVALRQLHRQVLDLQVKVGEQHLDGHQRHDHDDLPDGSVSDTPGALPGDDWDPGDRGWTP